MKIFRNFLFIFSLALLGWLFIQNIYLLNIVPVKNNNFLNSEISKLENTRNFEDLKLIAKQKTYLLQRNFQENSSRANNNLYIIFTIITIHLFMFYTQKPKINLKKS